MSNEEDEMEDMDLPDEMEYSAQDAIEA